MITDKKAQAIIFKRINDLEFEIELTKIKLNETGNRNIYTKLNSRLEDLKLLKKLNEAILYKNSGLFHNSVLQ